MKRLLFVIIFCYISVLGYNLRHASGQSDKATTPTELIKSYQEQLSNDPTRFDIRLQLAKVYLQIEGYRLSLTEYREIISLAEKTPDSISELTDAYYGLGLAYSGLEKFNEAIEAFNHAIQYISDRAHIHAALGAAYTNLHQYDNALGAYKTANRLNPSDAMIHHQLGNIYSKRGKRQQAILHQEKAITISPDLASAHYQLGLLYTQENLLEDAIAAYENAYQEDAELTEALYNLAQTYFRVGNTEAAHRKMQLFEKQKVALKPIQGLRSALHRTIDISQRAGILTNIGRQYLKNENYEKAVMEYEKALGLVPKIAEAYNGVGIAYVMLRRYSDAIAAQNKALTINPDFAEAHAGLGLVYLMQKKDELALRHYRKAITLSQNKPKFEEEVHHKIGLILLNKKKYSEAVISFQAVLALNPNHGEVYHNLGLSYAHQDRTEDALLALKKAVEIIQKQQDPNADHSDSSSTQPPFHSETYYLMGELLTQQKDYNEAKTAYLASGLPKAYNALAQLTAKVASTYEKPKKRMEMLDSAVSYAQTAIRLNPEIASYHNTYALICFKRGDYKTAEKSIRKAIALDPTSQNYQEGLKHIQKIMSQQ